MTTLASSLGQAGPGITQTIGGKTWTLTRSTKNIQAAWGKWFADRVEQSVMETAAKYRKQARALRKDVEEWNKELYADDLPAPARNVELSNLIDEANKEITFLEFEARAIIERFHDRKGAGEFEYHGNASITLAMSNLPGQFMLAYLCLQPKHPEVTLEEVTESYKEHPQEWAEFLVQSEGVKKKSVANEPDSTAASSTDQKKKSSTQQPTSPAVDLL